MANDLPDNLIDPTDTGALRQHFMDQTVAGLKSYFPVANNQYTLDLQDLKFAPKKFTKAEEEKAVIEGRTLSVPLEGTWILKDVATGQDLGQRRTTVARVPFLTDRGVFVYRGNDYTISPQSQLRHGAYSRKAASGEPEIVFHVEAPSGGNPGYRLSIDPAKGTFRLGVKQSEIKLYDLLHGLGVDDTDIEKWLGKDLFLSNKEGSDPRAFQRAQRALIGDTPVEGDPAAVIRDHLSQHKFDPDLAERAVGLHTDHMSPDVLLAAAKRLAELSRGTAHYSPRDAIYTQRFVLPGDQVYDRISKDRGGVARKLLWKVSGGKGLDAIPLDVFSPVFQSVFFRSGVAMPPAEANPMEVLDQQYRSTRLGEGGLASIQAVPEEARWIQPSHAGYIDPARSPESGKVGVDNRIAYGVKFGRDGNLYAPMTNARTGKEEYVSSARTKDLVIGFPGEEQSKRPMAIVQGTKQDYVNPYDVDYYLLNGQNMFTPLSNLIPMFNGVKQGRVLVGGKFAAAALPLEHGEAPLVQSKVAREDQSWEQKLGVHAGAVKTPVAGTVTAIGQDGTITVHGIDNQDHQFDLYQNLPLNQRSFLHQMPVVEPGQKVKPGQTIARSNFTDDTGTLAIGVNLRTALIPQGDTYEDAMYVSESAAKKLSSIHAYAKTVDRTPETVVGKNSYVSLFPSVYDQNQLQSVDQDGLVKPGTIVNKGDPLILSYHRRAKTPYYYRLRGEVGGFANDSLTWDKPWRGIVTHSNRTRDGWQVIVQTLAPAEEGDKVSIRMGGKGVLANVVPDSHMPHNRDGQPLELVISPLMLQTRGNPAAIAEMWLGKVAQKTGKPYVVETFQQKNIIDFALQELRAHDLTPEEELVDPNTGRTYNNPVTTGTVYLMKLQQMAEDKAKGRGIGARYTTSGDPGRGGEEGAKRSGNQLLYAMLSHNALANLSDAWKIKGAKNDDYWRAVQMGLNPATPQVPYIHRKYLDLLKGAGLNVTREGTKLNLTPITDKEILDVSAGPLENSETLDQKTLRPVDGGLFDAKYGGPGGNQWGHIVLPFPIPNPVMAPFIARIVGVKEKDIPKIIMGYTDIPGYGTGPEALQKALSAINVETQTKQLEQDLPNMGVTKRNDAYRKLRYLRALQKFGIEPAELMINNLPVVPPAARSVSQVRNQVVVGDPNQLYRDIIDVSQEYQKALTDGVPDEIVKEFRGRLYDSARAVIGVGEPVTREARQKHLRGVLGILFGSGRKGSFLLDKIIGRSVDLSGSAVITPNSALNMDQVGLPEKTAWSIYRPFVIRKLVRDGYGPADAVRNVKDESNVATAALQSVMDERPLLVNRAPTLHKFGIMAFHPILTKGRTLEVSPVITPGFAADFDGDVMLFHVPVSAQAVDEAQDMLPSKNLYSRKSMGVHYIPTREFLQGLFLASRTKKAVPRTFQDMTAAIAAFKRGDLSADDPIVIVNK